MPIIDPALLHGIHLTRTRHAGAMRPDAVHDTVFQTSMLDALLDGAYEGDLTFAELARHGDFGIGTLQALDGEMVALDGEFFVARADGCVSRVPPDTKTPFAVVTFWEPGGICPLAPATSLEDLLAQLDRCVGPADDILAVRVNGHFARIQARSVFKQSPPYPPLADVTAQQTVFEWTNVNGTLVGFRFPRAARGYDMAGYHLHFLSTDRRLGGHLLDCALAQGAAQHHRSTDLHVEIPRGLAWHRPGASDARDAVLKRVEGTA